MPMKLSNTTDQYRLFWVLVGLVILVTTVWFRDKSFLAGGEESFFLSNPKLAFQTHLDPDKYALRAMGFYRPRLTFIGLAAGLYTLGLPVWFIQYLAFLALILSGCVGVYVLTREIFPENRQKFTAFTAGLFYFFNLYTFSQVWGRFIYNGFFAWALLPWHLYLYIKFTSSLKIQYLLFSALIGTVLSHTFGNPAFILTVWAPVVIYTLVNRNLKSFIIYFTVWLLTNSWWLYGEAKFAATGLFNIASWKENLNSLSGVSVYFPTSEILFLKQKFLFGAQSTWSRFYNHPTILALSVCVFLLVIFGWWKARKSQSWRWLSVLALLGWFVSKGTNPPVGNIFFTQLFSLFPALGVLRNSYEKFGLVWLLPYTLFFAVGLTNLPYKSIRILILFLVCGILVWPMWTGNLYANIRVSIPDYYRLANDFVNQDKTSGNILMLPMLPGDGVRYTWGYQGIEPSEFLFDKRSISKILRLTHEDIQYWDLYQKLTSGRDFTPNLRQGNIKYLILHYDLNHEISGASTAAQVESVLTSTPNIKFLQKIGELGIYQFSNGGQEVGL